MQFNLRVGLDARTFIRNVSIRAVTLKNGQSCVFHMPNSFHSIVGGKTALQEIVVPVEVTGVFTKDGAFTELNHCHRLRDIKVEYVLEPYIASSFEQLEY